MSFATLGAFPFHVTGLEIGARPRTIGVSCNALSPEPVQTVDFVSGYMPVTISGFMVGLDTTGETAAEHLKRLRANLKTEVGKDHNTLLINWTDVLGDLETYRVFRNEDYALVIMDSQMHAKYTHRVDFTLTLNCLP